MIRSAFTMVFLCFALARAETLEELVAADHLRIRTWISPEQNIVATQQVVLYIEIATGKWFRGGTRIGRFEMPSTIVLQREQMAVNSTKREGRKTWATQLWSLTLYPQLAGTYEVPPIELRLKVAGEESSLVEGRILTEPLVFEVFAPDSLRDETNWVATTRFEITEAYNREDEVLKPGDALQRTVRFQAENLAAMMLPGLEARPIDGLALYRKSPRIQDRVQRGSFQAQRTETITYMCEKPGAYRLPPLTFTWWDLGAGAVRTITLPERVFRVEGEVPAKAPRDPLAWFPGGGWRLGTWVVVLAAMALFFLKWRRRRKKGPIKPAEAAAVPTEAELRRAFERACRAGNHAEAIGNLYRWLDNYGTGSYQGSIRDWLEKNAHREAAEMFNLLTRETFGINKGVRVDPAPFPKMLPTKPRKWHWWRPKPVSLQINSRKWRGSPDPR